jgi:hypothetical protein
MKTISWHWFAIGKFKSIFFTLVMVAFWSACSDDSVNLNGLDADASTKAKANINSTSSYSDYDIVVSVSTDGSEWTYTITKKLLAGGKWSKDLSHLIINLQNCGEESATFSDILYATVNGEYASFVNAEGSGTGCNPQDLTTNFVKIDDIASASSWVIVIKYDRGYNKVETQGWIKAGSSCNLGVIYGPGCPITEYCSYGQGYFFAGERDNGQGQPTGSYNNGADEVWIAAGGLTIGGKTYTHDEGTALWDANTGQGLSNEMKAFFQLGALILSDVAPPELVDEINTIESYFAGLSKVIVDTCTKQNGPNTVNYDCINLPDNTDVSTAAGVIGEWIAANKCDELD